MVIASVLALALAAAEAPEAPPPAATAPAAAAPAAQPETPSGAPTDDYGFVAWCHGALAGHMELYSMVKPELDKVSPGGDDTEQMKAGRDYLDLYARAMRAAEQASPTNIKPRGEEAEAQGYRIWAAARAAEPRTQMWSYLMWELPARCETAARRLEARASLLGQALRPGAGAAPAEGQ
jgi:hypothetical protein